MFSIILLDIDHFKAINDTHGREAGDQVLEKLAARLGAQLRKVDILGRYGAKSLCCYRPKPAGPVRGQYRNDYLGIADKPIETSQGS